MSKEIKISSMSDYINHICAMQKEYKATLQLPHYSFLFRGQESARYELLPSLARNRSSRVSYSILNEERNLLSMAQFQMPSIFHRNLSPIETLALAQHYGIPTRLLDVTENPLVALYFACVNRTDEDGEVVIFKAPDTDICTFPVVQAIADTCKFAFYDFVLLSDFYARAVEQDYFAEQRYDLKQCHSNNVEGGKWIEECCKNIFYIHAPIQTQRQRAQQGRYILFPNQIENDIEENEGVFTMIINAIPKNHKDIVLRFIIPKELKTELLSNLSMLGITKSSLFPDNTDIACNEIAELFKNRYTI